MVQSWYLYSLFLEPPQFQGGAQWGNHIICIQSPLTPFSSSHIFNCMIYIEMACNLLYLKNGIST